MKKIRDPLDLMVETMTDWKAKVKALQELGCADRSCLFKDNSGGGQHTNSGCHCGSRSAHQTLKDLIKVIKEIPVDD